MAKRFCIKKNNLIKNGFSDLRNWLENKNNIYIGKDMTHLVPSSEKSKWCNPYTVKEYGKENALKMYSEYIKKEMYDELDELQNKNLGCFCEELEICHADILITLLKEKQNNKKEKNKPKKISILKQMKKESTLTPKMEKMLKEHEMYLEYIRNNTVKLI